MKDGVCSGAQPDQHTGDTHQAARLHGETICSEAEGYPVGGRDWIDVGEVAAAFLPGWQVITLEVMKLRVAGSPIAYWFAVTKETVLAGQFGEVKAVEFATMYGERSAAVGRQGDTNDRQSLLQM